jgi:hypothetical protein
MLVRGRCLCFHPAVDYLALRFRLARFRSFLALHHCGQPDCRSSGCRWRCDYFLSFRSASSEVSIPSIGNRLALLDEAGAHGAWIKTIRRGPPARGSWRRVTGARNYGRNGIRNDFGQIRGTRSGSPGTPIRNRDSEAARPTLDS